mgnify:CR=1 FL=1
MANYNFRAPAQPLAPAEYLQAQQDQFQNALRLYFNRLDNYNSLATIQLNSQNVLMWASAGSGMWSS